MRGDGDLEITEFWGISTLGGWGILKGVILSSFYFGGCDGVEWILSVFMLGGYGGLEKTNFGQFSLGEDMVVLEGLIF